MAKPFQFESLDKRLLFTVLAMVAFFALQHALQQPQWSPPIRKPVVQSPLDKPFYHEQLVPNGGQNSSHSVSHVVLPSGDLMAFWFAGTREGHRDVQIFRTVFHQQSERWDEPTPLLNVPQMNHDLGRFIGKLGNPLVFVDSRERMWLFFVTVSYGGWAGSSLNVMWSDDLGKAWTRPKRLVTSPFLNVSTLVRNSMLELEDGSLLLPVYHEFAAQFPEALRIGRSGEVISKTRMHGHGGGIQPVFVQGEQNSLYALMRSGSHTDNLHVLSVKSMDQGQSWQDFRTTTLPNPNSAQVAMRVADKLWIWVGNHNQQDRRDMTLAVTDNLDGDWQVVYHFEAGKEGERFAYPAITQDKQGIFHLMYTYNRKNMKHIRFNGAWLKQQVKAL